MVRWSAVAVVAALATLASLVGATGVLVTRSAATHMPVCSLTSARTGDVVLFRWDGTGIVHDLVSTYSHVGLVIVRDGEPWILETHKVGDARDLGYGGDGVRAYPLAERVQTYPGAAWILRLHPSLSVSSKDLERAFASLESTPYDYHSTKRMASCFVDTVLGVGGSHASHKMFCSEFVGELLRRLGVLSSEYDTACLTPESFAHMPHAYPHMQRLR